MTFESMNLSLIESLIIPEMPKDRCGVYTSDQIDLSGVEVLPEYKFVLKAIKTGSLSFFVSGKAGTGKSTFITWITRKLERCAVVCPTAIAAANINGDTIHSFFGLPPFHIEPDEEFQVSAKSRVVLENLDYLIIDEVSMLLPNIVDAMSNILKRVRRSEKPFGGVATVFVGDLLQLPPVVSSKEEKLYFSHRYKTPYFFSADVFKEHEIIPVHLTKVRRQTDEGFVEALNHIRLNKDLRDHVELFNRKCFRNKKGKNSAEGIVLVPTNAVAKQINTRRLNSLSGGLRVYDADVTGVLPANKWKLPVPDRLELKIGAKVIFLKNNKPDWINGDLAEIVGLEKDHIRVRKLLTDNVLVVDKMVWQELEYTYNYVTKKIEKKEIGTFRQFPIALGWAITIHKSQGMTLENLTLDLGRGAFCGGQTYVALSRATSIEGITLSQPIKMQDVIVDPIVLEFYKRLGMEG